MSILRTYSLEQLVNLVYEPEDADEFMGNWHRGAFAKAVKGDESAYVDPQGLTGKELENARQYFIGRVVERGLVPA